MLLFVVVVVLFFLSVSLQCCMLLFMLRFLVDSLRKQHTIQNGIVYLQKSKNQTNVFFFFASTKIQMKTQLEYKTYCINLIRCLYYSGWYKIFVFKIEVEIDGWQCTTKQHAASWEMKIAKWLVFLFTCFFFCLVQNLNFYLPVNRLIVRQVQVLKPSDGLALFMQSSPF